MIRKTSDYFWMVKKIISKLTEGGRHCIHQVILFSSCLVWFHHVFHSGAFGFCKTLSWIPREICTVTVEWYIKFLRDHVTPSLYKRHVLHVFIFMKDCITTHFARELKTLLLGTFNELWVINRNYKFEWLSWSPEYIGCGNYLKSCV